MEDLMYPYSGFLVTTCVARIETGTASPLHDAMVADDRHVVLLCAEVAGLAAAAQRLEGASGVRTLQHTFDPDPVASEPMPPPNPAAGGGAPMGDCP
jgi:hypothetical protein